MSQLSVETAIQAEIDEIAAVRGVFSGVVVNRNANALWNLAWTADDVLYDNRVLNSNLSGVDSAIQSVTIGSSIFAPWFTLHSNYFALDAGLLAAITSVPVSTVQQAIADYYRWRVSQYFNQCMIESLSLASAIPNKNVFPRPDLVIGTYAVLTSSTGTFTPGSGTIPTTGLPLSGPGTIGVYATSTINGANDILAITVVREDLSTYVAAATMPSASTIASNPIPVGVQAITACNSITGVITMAATAQFAVGQKVLVRASAITAAGFAAQEIADVLSIATGVSITVGKSSQTGTPLAGLRGTYTSSGFVYPQWTNITGVTNSTGTAADALQFKFIPDRAQVI